MSHDAVKELRRRTTSRSMDGTLELIYAYSDCRRALKSTGDLVAAEDWLALNAPRRRPIQKRSHVGRRGR